MINDDVAVRCLPQIIWLLFPRSGHPTALSGRDGLPGHGLLVRAEHNVRVPVGTRTSAICILPWFICAVPITHPLLRDVDAFQ